MVLTPLLGVRPRQEPVPYPCEREQKQRLTEAHRLGLRRGTQATTGVVKPQVPAVWIPEGGCNRLGCVRSGGSASGLVCGVVAALPLGLLISQADHTSSGGTRGQGAPHSSPL